MAVKNEAKSYYRGGHRLVIDGVPCRIASRPTRNRATMLRQSDAFSPVSDGDDRFSAKRCEARYRAAMRAMRAAMASVDREAA